MARKTQVKFNAKKFGSVLLAQIVKEQTARLVAYAEEEMQRIGNDIAVANTKHNLDRTGNLLDSLCFAVYYNGKRQKNGYYRSETAIEDSYLHEYSKPKGQAVNGHFLAKQFLSSYKPKDSGWEVFFAILAPYWGYWEKGFTHAISNKFFQWQVMTHHFDMVKAELEPANVAFETYIPR